MPFGGLIGPFGDIHGIALSDRLIAAAQAWLFYSSLSLGLVQILGSSALGLVAGRFAKTPRSRNVAVAGVNLLFSQLAVLGLFTLDWYIGPWQRHSLALDDRSLRRSHRAPTLA